MRWDQPQGPTKRSDWTWSELPTMISSLYFRDASFMLIIAATTFSNKITGQLLRLHQNLKWARSLFVLIDNPSGLRMTSIGSRSATQSTRPPKRRTLIILIAWTWGSTISPWRWKYSRRHMLMQMIPTIQWLISLWPRTEQAAKTSSWSPKGTFWIYLI